MRRLLLVSTALVLAAGLAACGEPTTNAKAPKTADAKAWQGTSGPYAAAGWQAGDQTSWEEQMRTRARSQNEYAKVQ